MNRTTEPSEDNLLTTEDVLTYLRVNARTVYRLIRDGELRAVRVGRQWRVRRQDLDRFVAAQRIALAWPAAVNE